MKQFDLGEYLRLKEEGKEPKIVTRDGKSVRIICTDLKGFYPVVALILYDSTDERPHSFHADGGFDSYGRESNLDLFFAPTKRKGWVNVCGSDRTRWCSNVYKTEAEAIKNVSRKDIYITTVPIEWEE